MERSKFEAELQRDGYQVVVNTMQPGAINPEHQHDFDARLLVVDGEMTIEVCPSNGPNFLLPEFVGYSFAAAGSRVVNAVAMSSPLKR